MNRSLLCVSAQITLTVLIQILLYITALWCNLINVHQIARQALQICSLLCMSLAEVQGNCLIFMEIRDNIHQLSFTSFIFISFLILTLYARRPLSARFAGVFLDCWDLCTSHISAMRTLSNTHTLNLRGRQTFPSNLHPAHNFPSSWGRKVRCLTLALPAAHTQPVHYTFHSWKTTTASSVWQCAVMIHKWRTWCSPGWT